MRRLLQSLTLAVLTTALGVSLAWAEGLQFAVKADGTPPCQIQWFEGKTYNYYLSTVKGTPGTLQTTGPNSFLATPPRMWFVPCPLVPGQYYATQAWVNDQGEGSRSFENAFMVIDPKIPVVMASITPFAGKQGESVPVTIAGSGMSFSGIPAALKVSGGIVISNLVIKDAQITAVLTIPAAEPVGAHDVVLGGPAPALVQNVASGFTVLANVIPVFAIGVKVQTNLLLNVRQSAGSTAPLAGAPQPKNATGTIVDGPVVVAGSTWWKIDYTTGTDGWSMQGLGTTPYLTIVP